MITGSAGLVGSAAARFYAAAGWRVIGVDDDSRARYFGDAASTRPERRRLEKDLGSAYRHAGVDIRDRSAVTTLYRRYGADVAMTIHAAAQPSHDYSAANPMLDWDVNAGATVSLLDAHRHYTFDAPFVFLSTNKVYGDLVNLLDYDEQPTRFDLPEHHRLYDGVDETMRIDQSQHSPFGASKTAADLMVQEYGRYFEIPTACLRGGTLSGGASAGAELHGFLAHLVRCCVEGGEYRIIGYGGRQVRDVLHADDVVAAIEAFRSAPRTDAVYNLGGGRANSVSVVEAIRMTEAITGRELRTTLDPEARRGDHQWWITSTRRLERDHDWRVTRSVASIIEEIAALYTPRPVG